MADVAHDAVQSLKGKTVAVIFGGHSSERDISIASANAVLTALRAVAPRVGMTKVLDIDTALPLNALVTNLMSVDVVFPILHGTAGEDGALQGVLEYLKIPYTGSGVRASAIAFDKFVTKVIWRNAGLSTPDFKVYRLTQQDFEAMVAEISLWLEQQALIIKPRDEGSSVLMFKPENAQEVRQALLQILQQRQNSQVLVEEWIEGPEYTVAVVADEVLPSIQIRTPRVFYDYQAKYHATDTEYLCPSGLSEAEEEVLKALALQAYQCLGCESWGRIDLMRRDNGQFELIEINTLPGMTERSLVPMAAKAVGWSFTDLILKILATASLKQ